MLGRYLYQPQRTPLPAHRCALPDVTPWRLDVAALRLACPGGTLPRTVYVPSGLRRRDLGRVLLIKQVEHEERED